MGSGGEKKQLQLPLIDLCGLDPENPTTQEWGAARRAVVEALETYGCFDAIYDRPGLELREELFGRAIPELFALPLEVKMKNSSPDAPYGGYIGQIPGLAYESLRVGGAATLEGAQRFTSLMWPQGNPTFCTTAWTYAKHMQELAQMVQRMVLQDLGLEKYSGLHSEPETSGLRLAEYGTSLTGETMAGMASHKDPNMFTIICQHQVEGLEIQTKDGEWIRVIPSLNSFTLMIGEAFTAWTNGRFQAPWHRVKMTGDAKRYSVLYGTRPRDDSVVQPLEEPVDSGHPLLFKPFRYKDYIEFRFSDEGRKYGNTLEAYCGVGSEGKACELKSFA